MFDKKWFIKHQKKLLWLLNTPLIRVWFRWVLKINGKRSSVRKNKIIGILPNVIFWKGKKRNEYVAEFRTHNKFSKRIKYAFYPIWHMIHLWDTLIANNFKPEWNLGFDVLTVHPDPHPETTTVDGYVWYHPNNSTWSAVREHTTATDVDDSASAGLLVFCVSSAPVNYFDGLCRGILLFDTASLGGNSTISSATLSYYTPDMQFFGQNNLRNDLDGNNSESVNIVSSNPASNTELTANDYYHVTRFGATPFSTAKNVSTQHTLNAYNDFSLNSNGITNISKTGVSKFGVRLVRDINNSPTTNSGGNKMTLMGIYYADQTGTSQDPKLVVNFTDPMRRGGSFLFNLI